MSTPSLPLALVREGTPVRLVAIQGSQRTAHRLAELGLTPGVTVTVLRDNGSALLLAVGDTRIALSYGLAQMVLVTGEELRDG